MLRSPCSSPSHGTPAPRAHPCPLPSQLQNLGFFPVEGVTIKLTVPVATRAGNRLLLLTEFMVDQVGRGFHPIKHARVSSAPGVGMGTPHGGSPHPFANPPPPYSHLHGWPWLMPELLPFAFAWLETWKMVAAKGFGPNISLS